MTNTYDMIHVRKRELHELVHDNAGKISEAEERVISEHDSVAHGARVQHALVRKHWSGLHQIQDKRKD